MKDVCPHLAKLDPKGLKVVFIGYEPGSKVYRFSPAEGQAHVLRDIIFYETTFWQWNDVTEVDQNPNQFTVEYLVTELRKGGAQHWEPPPPPAAAPGTPTPTPTTTPAAPPDPVEFATPRIADSTLDADHDDDLVARYRRMEDLLGGGVPPELVMRELEDRSY